MSFFLLLHWDSGKWWHEQGEWNIYSWHHSPCDSSNSSPEILYGDLAGHCGKIGGYVWELALSLSSGCTWPKVGPFSRWCGHAPCPLLLLFNVHDNIHERTGRSWPPAFIPRAPSTGPTAPCTIYLLRGILYTRFPSGKCLGEWRKNEIRMIQYSYEIPAHLLEHPTHHGWCENTHTHLWGQTCCTAAVKTVCWNINSVITSTY